jgi:hypothetical protein
VAAGNISEGVIVEKGIDTTQKEWWNGMVIG